MSYNQSLRDGILEKILVRRHCITLNLPDVALTRTDPHRSGSCKRVFEKEGVDQILEAEIAGPVEHKVGVVNCFLFSNRTHVTDFASTVVVWTLSGKEIVIQPRNEHVHSLLWQGTSAVNSRGQFQLLVDQKWQKWRPEDRFATHHGLFCYTKMLFEIRIASHKSRGHWGSS